MKVHWMTTASENDLVRSDLTTEEMHGLKEDSVQLGRRACGSEGIFMTVVIATVFVFSRAVRKPCCLSLGLARTPLLSPWHSWSTRRSSELELPGVLLFFGPTTSFRSALFR